MGQQNGSPSFGPIDMSGGAEGMREQVMTMLRNVVGNNPGAEGLLGKGGKLGGANDMTRYGLPSTANVPRATGDFYHSQSAPDTSALLEAMIKRGRGGAGPQGGMPSGGVVVR